MIRNPKKNNIKYNESEFISRVRSELFDLDNSAHRAVVDRIMDETGETAAEIASALVGMLLRGAVQPAQKNSKASSVPLCDAKSASAKRNEKKSGNKAQETLSKKRAHLETKQASHKPHEPSATKQARNDMKPAHKTEKNTADKRVKLMISGGHNKKFTHKDIVGALIARAGLSADELHGIQIRERQTLLEVPACHAERVVSVLNSPDGKIKGVPVKAQIAKDRKK